MGPLTINDGELMHLLASPYGSEDLSTAAVRTGQPLVLITPTGTERGSSAVDALPLDTRTLGCILVGAAEPDAFAPQMADALDLFVPSAIHYKVVPTTVPDSWEHQAWHAICTHTIASPLAAVALCLLLRGSAARSLTDSLVAESTTYSMLQGGPEFARWRSENPPPTEPDHPATTPAAVLIERTQDRMTITLNRPDRHNAIDTTLRDALTEALAVALFDKSIEAVTLRGNGPSFCSGGDLATFATFPDPATAHLVRLARSPARLLVGLAARLGDRLRVQVQGATYGGGIELAGFAGYIEAHPNTRFALPEISLGLIPGAGGTASLPRRIGRHRTALLALSGLPIKAEMALDWGLIDEIVVS